MHNNKKNEELQSRREFFKKAAKGALPIIGAMVLAHTPFLAKAADDSPMGCRGNCSYGCGGACSVVVQEVAKEAVAVRVLGAVRIPVKALAQAVVEVDAAV